MPVVEKFSSCADCPAASTSEDKEHLDECLENLKQWAEKHPNLHLRKEDKYLLIFLRCCKYDLKKTKEKIKNFYVMKRDRRELFSNRDPHSREIQGLIRMGTFFVLKNLHQNSPVIIIRPTVRDPSVYTLDHVLQTGSMVMDILAMEDELAQINGIITIVDLTNVSLRNVVELSLSRLKHMVVVWQNYYCRPQKIVFMNVPTYINVFLKIVMGFMTAKMRERIYINHDSNFSPEEVVERRILPPEYGGEGESIEELSNYWMQKLISYTNWFKEDETFKAD